MKKIVSLLSALVLSAVMFAATAAPQAIVVGHNNRTISIIDLESKDVVWQYPLPNKEEQCNSVVVLSDGEHIAFSTQLNVKVVSLKTKKLVWEYQPDPDPKSYQVHSVVPFKKGGFAVFIAGTPVEVLEVSSDFKITKEVELTELSGSTNPHGMFRQVSMTKSGNYILPWFPTGVIYELSREGKILDTYPVDNAAFAVRELPNGNLFLGTGDNSTIIEYNTTDKSVVREISAMQMGDKEAWLQYLSQSEEIAKGKYMVANWIGHGKKHEPKRTDFLPILMVINDKGDVEWCYTTEDNKDIQFISGFFYSKKPIVSRVK